MNAQQHYNQAIVDNFVTNIVQELNNIPNISDIQCFISNMSVLMYINFRYDNDPIVDSDIDPDIEKDSDDHHNLYTAMNYKRMLLHTICLENIKKNDLHNQLIKEVESIKQKLTASKI